SRCCRSIRSSRFPDTALRTNTSPASPIRRSARFHNLNHHRRHPSRLSMLKIPVIVQTVGLLTLSNIFMTFAWYGHLKGLASKPWWIAALLSWGIALFEYLLQVPANRIGYTEMSLAQLKILQEA